MSASRLCRSRRSCIAIALLIACGVTSCGQKGPLYLPDEQKEPVKKNTIPIPAPISKEEEKNRSKEESKAP
jgi:predicted small lipoprotein YifL